jgi:hypothetical protein
MTPTATAVERALASNLLAEDADTARTTAGPCAGCQHAILRGHRYARLLSGKLAHVDCISRMTVRSRPMAARQ